MVQMKFLKFIILVFALTGSFYSAAEVTFEFSGGSIAPGALKTKMEKNISSLLSEINRAGTLGTTLNLNSVNMEPGAKERLMALWNASHFVCNRETNIYRCLNDYQGYQVRDIPITMKPQDDSYEQSMNRQLTMSLNKNGIITGVRLAFEHQEDVSKIMQDANGVADTRMRREILKWVEDFRCYYNEKNLESLNQIYSDDALIITGSVVTQRKIRSDSRVTFKRNVKYTVQSKQEYMAKLSDIFRTNDLINIEFDHISVLCHPADSCFYGVTLHQKWHTRSAYKEYKDVGWLFLVWNFSDPERPQIHLRTWQEEQATAKDGVFSINDFIIP